VPPREFSGALNPPSLQGVFTLNGELQSESGARRRADQEKGRWRPLKVVGGAIAFLIMGSLGVWWLMNSSPAVVILTLLAVAAVIGFAVHSYRGS